MIRQLRAANEELAQLDALRRGLLEISRLNMLSMMVSALAHDVSQPLTAAKNYLSVLRRGRTTPGFDDAKVEQMLAKTAAQIDRASDIVKDLRALMAANATVHRSESIAAVVAEAARLSRDALAASDAELTIDVDPALPRAKIDRVKIQQLIVNLLINAAAALAGRERRSVRISAWTVGRAMRLEVADTGTGLPPDVAQRLAEPHSATRMLEFGLGLPISRQIVQEHGGEFSFAPNSPAGAVFAFTLPLA